MKWTKTGAAIAVLAAGWWLLQRATPAAADGGGQGSRPSGVVTPSNPDPGMVKILPNPDPKMVVTPPWPRDNTIPGSGTEQQ